MDVEQTLRELRAERERIAEVIASLERLALVIPKRRGRRPKWVIEAMAHGRKSVRKLKGGSPAKR